uniref:Uncharacterized protein n=1 Tax=Alexandrium monilatum TaxID=311494 RepID=A0A7S4QGU8_9DINO
MAQGTPPPGAVRTPSDPPPCGGVARAAAHRRGRCSSADVPGTSDGACSTPRAMRALGRLPPRGLATATSPALVLVDGRRTVEAVRSELVLRAAAHPAGAELLVAGRQGTAIALLAAARAQAEGRPLAFTLARAGAEELSSAGLHPPGEGAGTVSGVGGDTAEQVLGRTGFRLAFPRSIGTPEAERPPAELPEPARLLVVGQTTKLLPLAKAIATEVARLPEGDVVAVETLLRGRPKNVWTRVHRLAEAVAQAHHWQVAPAGQLPPRGSPAEGARGPAGDGSAAAGPPEAAAAAAASALRLTLLRQSGAPG